MREKAGTPRLYAIADADALAPRSLGEAVRRMAERGVGWIQIRAKSLPDAELYAALEAVTGALDRHRTHLWVDDRADLAALFDCSVHLGQEDLPAAEARRLLGDRGWIGVSTHDEEQVRAAAADPAVDVVAVGPVFPTRSKSDPDPVVGLDLVRRARELTDKPLVAIGGLDPRRIAAVLRAGADTAAVLGDLCRGDLDTNLERYRSWLRTGRRKAGAGE